MDGGDHSFHGGVHRRKRTKKTKQPLKKNKPLKVVYISNPMKFQISASKFMSLVQQLTGQHADFPDPSKFYSAAANDGGDDATLIMNDNSPNYSNSLVADQLSAEDDFLGSFYDEYFDELILPPPMIGDFSGLLPAPATAAYDSSAR